MDKRKESIEPIIEELKGKFSAPHSLILGFGSLVLEVFSNSESLVKKIHRYYGNYVYRKAAPNITITVIEAPPPDLGLDFKIKPPDPGKKKIKEEYVDLSDGRVVRKKLTGMVFIFGGGNNFAIGPALENHNQIVNFINNRYIEWLIQCGFLLAHASGIEWKGNGIAIAGISGAGKSTLALHLMERGADFVSNDRLLIQKNRMFGIAKHPRINPGTALNNSYLGEVIPREEREKFNQLPPDKLWDLEHKYDVFIDEFFGKKRSVLSSTLNLVIILNWKRKSLLLQISNVNLSERRDLLHAFMKPVGLFYHPENGNGPPDLSEELYIEHLRGCPVFEFSGGVDFQKATDYCIEFINKRRELWTRKK